MAKAFDAVEKEIVRRVIAVDKKRPDGRGVDEIRPLDCDTKIAPRTHGSGLFTRGQTQVLTLLTLGAARDEQRVDGLGIEESKRFMHHYKFPPFSVGEAGFMRGPGRRDIGHGALAERALVPVIPDEEAFPYTIRLVSETLESNGSSSMASVCASTLALMDAGVPIARPVAGIAMGLVKEGDDYVVLTDIAGVEDHLGDMDFKVAGTDKGITALQMDIKIQGVTFEIMKDALERARKARLFILDKITSTLSAPRPELSDFAPRIATIRIDPEKIGAVIGKGGETIRGMEAEFECTIDVAEDGLIKGLRHRRQAGRRLHRAHRSAHPRDPGGRHRGGQGGLYHVVRGLCDAQARHRRSCAHLAACRPSRGDRRRSRQPWRPGQGRGTGSADAGGQREDKPAAPGEPLFKGRQWRLKSTVLSDCPQANAWSPRSLTI